MCVCVSVCVEELVGKGEEERVRSRERVVWDDGVKVKRREGSRDKGRGRAQVPEKGEWEK